MEAYCSAIQFMGEMITNVETSTTLLYAARSYKESTVVAFPSTVSVFPCWPFEREMAMACSDWLVDHARLW